MQATDITIRFALANADTIAAINTVHEARGLPLPDAGQLIAQLNNRNNDFLLAFAGGSPAGYVWLHRGQRPEALQQARALEIAALHGINDAAGDALLQRCQQLASQQKFELLWHSPAQTTGNSAFVQQGFRQLPGAEGALLVKQLH